MTLAFYFGCYFIRVQLDTNTSLIYWIKMIDFHDPRFQKGHNGTKHKDELAKYYSLTILRALTFSKPGKRTGLFYFRQKQQTGICFYMQSVTGL